MRFDKKEEEDKADTQRSEDKVMEEQKETRYFIVNVGDVSSKGMSSVSYLRNMIKLCN